MDASPARVGRTVKQVQWRHHRAVDSRLRRHGLTIMQWDALRAIENEPGATSRRLAAETFQSEQSFGAMATRMEARGLIARTAGIGRAIEHRLTDEGRRLLAVGTEISAAVLASTIGVLDAGDRATLLTLLERVRDAGDAADAAGDAAAGDDSAARDVAGSSARDDRD